MPSWRAVCAGLAVVAAGGCSERRADICERARTRTRILGEVAGAALVGEAREEEKALTKRIATRNVRGRDATFMGLCAEADEATLACIHKANEVFEDAAKTLERTCGASPSPGCKAEVYAAMDVEDDACGERLLAFELRLQTAARGYAQ